jgi:hypothetical protein
MHRKWAIIASPVVNIRVQMTCGDRVDALTRTVAHKGSDRISFLAFAERGARS